MYSTEIAPSVPLGKFKRTKMIATIGPVTDSYEAILDLLKAGANGFRLNFSHGTHEERIQQIKWVRKASKEYGKPVAIIQDLQGPKVRLGDFEDVILVNKGQELQFAYKADYDRTGIIPTQYDLTKKVKRGERLLLYDGRIKTIVSSVSEGVVRARAENDGMLIKRKGINLPDTDFAGDILTKKDKADIVFGTERDIDYVALSFVQTGKDIKNLRRMLKNLGSDAQIIAKIETRAATENIDDIIAASDAVMVARGDLATEVGAETVPIFQRAIVGKCREQGKLSIVATQMLMSMTESPEPTRAEVSDVATAAIVGTDCVMLSDETAMGKYPIQAVETMKRIILYTEEKAPLKPLFFKETDRTVQSAISSAAITLAHQVDAKAIVAETKSGITARSIAVHRPNMPIIMVTSNKRTAQQLALVYGGKVYIRPDSTTAGAKLAEWLRKQKVFKKGDVVVRVSGAQPGLIGGTDTIKVRVME